MLSSLDLLIRLSQLQYLGNLDYPSELKLPSQLLKIIYILTLRTDVDILRIDVKDDDDKSHLNGDHRGRIVMVESLGRGGKLEDLSNLEVLK